MKGLPRVSEANLEAEDAPKGHRRPEPPGSVCCTGAQSPLHASPSEQPYFFDSLRPPQQQRGPFTFWEMALFLYRGFLAVARRTSDTTRSGGIVPSRSQRLRAESRASV